MTVYVVFGHDGKGAWIEDVYTTYDKARARELICKRSRQRNEFFFIATKVLVE